MGNIFGGFSSEPRDWLKQLLLNGVSRKVKSVLWLKQIIFKPKKLSAYGNQLDEKIQPFFLHEINDGLQKGHFC
jgi:hypothetical protein